MMSLQICGRPLLTVAGAVDDGLTALFPWPRGAVRESLAVTVRSLWSGH